MRRSQWILSYLPLLAAVVFLSAGTLVAQSPLMGYWNFDEASGQTVVDWSDHGNTGTIHSADRVAGKKGNALNFRGDTSSYVSVPNSPSLESGNRLTIECWVNTAQSNPVSGSGQTVIRKEKGYVFGIGSGGSVGFSVCPGMSWTGSWALSRQKIIPGTWTHIAGTWDGQTLKVYINGVLDSNTMSVGGSISPGSYNVCIGKFAESNYEVFKGSIDELKVFGVAFPADSINAHFHADVNFPALIPVSPDPTYDRRPVLRWHTGKNMTMYRLQIAVTPDFASPFVSIPTTDTSYAPLIDIPFGVIYWRVADATGSVPGWSSPSSFVVIDSTVPRLVPYVPDPTRNRKPTLTWHKTAGAPQYTIAISVISDLSAPIIQEPVVDTTYTPSVNLPTGRIFWRVRSRSDGQWSIPDTLTIINDTIPLLIPVLPKTQVDRRPALAWYTSAGASSYTVQIDSTPRFTSPIIYLPIADTIYNPKADLPLGQLFWKVCVTVNGTTYSSAVDSFVVVLKVKTENQGYRTGAERPFARVAGVGRGITAEFFLQKPDNIALEVYSVNGARLFSTGMLPAQSGARTLAWNGVDRMVSGGSYLTVCRMGSKKIVTRVIVLK